MFSDISGNLVVIDMTTAAPRVSGSKYDQKYLFTINPVLCKSTHDTRFINKVGQRCLKKIIE